MRPRRAIRPGRRPWLAVLLVLTLGSIAGPPGARAADAVPVRIPDQAVYDLAGVFSPDTEQVAERLADAIRSTSGADVVVVSETVPDVFSAGDAAGRAAALVAGMNIGDGIDGGLLAYFGIAQGGCGGQVDLLPTGAFADDVLSRQAADAIVQTRPPALAGDAAISTAPCSSAWAGSRQQRWVGRWIRAPSRAAERVAVRAPARDPRLRPPDPRSRTRSPASPSTTMPGSSAPTRSSGSRSRSTRSSGRTGAEVAVYSQVVEDGRSTEEADRDARALMDQWGVGRKGFDDGLVILFDMYPGLEHGQVILYGGPGFRATFLDNAAKQRIFDDDMLPRLRAGDFDGALLVAIQRVDAAATPQHAATLERGAPAQRRRRPRRRPARLPARRGLGPLVVAPVRPGSGLPGRPLDPHGRTPRVADPCRRRLHPRRVVRRGGRSRRPSSISPAVARSRSARSRTCWGSRRRSGSRPTCPQPTPSRSPTRPATTVRRLGPAERLALVQVEALGRAGDGYIDPERLLGLGAFVPAFDKALEGEVVARGWYAERPSAVVARWRLRGSLAIGAGAIALFGGFNDPEPAASSWSGSATLVAGVIVLVLAGSMPAVTLPGAMIRAMLAAYRRTLKKTMEQARSMDQVVADAGLSWLETPDQAVVWGTALGLHDEIEQVLGRTLDDERDGPGRRPAATWLPVWYGIGLWRRRSRLRGWRLRWRGRGSGRRVLERRQSRTSAGMMSALGSIGNSPSSSGGGGGGGGFSGGGSGGGGGGSGGGF